MTLENCPFSYPKITGDLHYTPTNGKIPEETCVQTLTVQPESRAENKGHKLYESILHLSYLTSTVS